jgi:hypothetical protein
VARGKQRFEPNALRVRVKVVWTNGASDVSLRIPANAENSCGSHPGIRRYLQGTIRCHTIALHRDGLGEQTANAERRYVQGDIRCHTIVLVSKPGDAADDTGREP